MTDIKDVALAGTFVEIVKQTTGNIMVRSRVNGRGEIAFVRPADLAAAVESELGVRIVPADAIVIERHPVHDGTNPGRVSVSLADRVLWRRIEDVTDEDVAEAQATILAAAHFAAHPPVDQAQVAAMAADLVGRDDADVNYLDADDARKYATHLVRLGWRKDGAR